MRVPFIVFADVATGKSTFIKDRGLRQCLDVDKHPAFIQVVNELWNPDDPGRFEVSAEQINALACDIAMDHASYLAIFTAWPALACELVNRVPSAQMIQVCIPETEHRIRIMERQLAENDFISAYSVEEILSWRADNVKLLSGYVRRQFPSFESALRHIVITNSSVNPSWLALAEPSRIGAFD